MITTHRYTAIFYHFIILSYINMVFYACDSHVTDDVPSMAETPTNVGNTPNLNKADEQSNSTEIIVPENCAFDADDPYEPRSRFTHGPWLGACHDTRKRRPVYQLEDSIAQQYQDVEGWTALANIYHADGFWIAFVPNDALETVFFQLEYFPAVIPAGHTQLRLKYEEPILLYGQSTHVLGQVDYTHDLVLSIEAVTQVGDRYDLFKGTQEHFSIAYRVTTLQARYHSMITLQNHHVEQWVLDLEPEEKQELLATYVANSSGFSLKYAYHTLFRNCTTEIIEILDQVVKYTWGEQVKKFLVKVTEIYPNIVRAALVARGLMPFDKSNDWFALEEDKEFIEQLSQDAQSE